MSERNFFAELKRRNVVRMAGLYLVAAWLLTQVASTVLPMFGAPDWLPRSTVILLAIGFIPALIFSWVFELTPQGLKRDEDVPADQSIGPQTARRMDRMIIAVLALALAYFAFDKWVLAPRRAPLLVAASASLATTNSKSIAVLPLVNTSGDPSNEYFSDGLSEELIAVLAKIPELKVVGRSSSFFFKGKSGDSAEIGQKLGVANLIEGSVRKQGDRVRIVAELIRAADGRSLWSETYDRELKDVFAVQAEIAKAVAEQMKVKLLGETVRPDAAGSSENPAAHNAVLQADFYFQQQTAESVRQAIKFLETAVRLDPNYALAYAKLAQAWRQYAASFSTEATDDTAKAYNEARRAGDMAVSLAPDLIETRMAVGLVALNPDLDFRTAEKEFRRVLQSAPSDAAAKSALSFALLSQGRLTEAERSCQEAISLDPLLTSSWINIGRVAIGLGRYQEAEQLFRKGLEIQPHASRFHSYLVTLDILQDRAAQAMANAQLESEGFWRDYAVNLAQQGQSDRSTADDALKAFIAKNSKFGQFQIAVLYAIRKEPDEMFKWLDTAYAARDSGLTQLAVTPFFLPYLRDQRFIALCQKLNVQLPATSVKP
jgi:TolB-like protein/Tfp pilus assembly protein PilF